MAGGDAGLGFFKCLQHIEFILPFFHMDLVKSAPGAFAMQTLPAAKRMNRYF
jgi:hypothetical protein